MALANFTTPFGSILPAQSWTTISPLQRHATAINNMLYGPAGHQQQQQNEDDPDYDYDYKNDPYAPPIIHMQQEQQALYQPPTFSQQQTNRRANDYLPPVRQSQTRQPPPQHPQQQQQQHLNNINSPDYSSLYTTRSFGSSLESTQRKIIVPQQKPLQPPLKQPQYKNEQFNVRRVTPTYPSQSQAEQPTQSTVGPQTQNQKGHNQLSQRGSSARNSGPNRDHHPARSQEEDGSDRTSSSITQNGGGGAGAAAGGFPSQAATYTRVQAGTGSHTNVHAILDYDDDEGGDDYYAERDGGANGDAHQMPTVTPIQGPIFLKNGSVPVVPLFSYPTMRNGTFVQIPIWWTALSVALGLEIRGEIIRGTPCVKKFNQLFCPTAGNSYPINRIAEFIDDNKALMRRMYGDFEMSTQYGPPSSGKRKRAANDIPPPGVPDFVGPPGSDMDEIPSPDIKGSSYFSNWRRSKRQSNSFGRSNNSTRGNSDGNGPSPPNEPVTGRVDACESKIEIVTPYWASNSAGKIRAIVNTQHFEQAIHQEVCTKSQTGRCGGDCGCEQKYKWHRLLAYDPDNDCRGIFMDWFLFPSCCVCRCNP